MTKSTPLLPEPLIDVVLPAYNCAATIAEAVESVRNQTVSNIRIIVIDDGSNDGTGDIVQRLADTDRRILLIRKSNSGIVDTRNLGISIARAPFIAVHDGDDISAPDRFQRQLDAFEADASLIAVSGACTHIDAAGRTLGTRYEPWSPELADFRAIPSLEPYLLQPFLMARRAAIDAIGGYRHALLAEDTDLYWRLRDQGKLANLPDSLGSMRIHQASITNRSVINGRISAIHSQLAAISAARRAAGRADIDFPDDALASFCEAQSLERMLRLAGQRLDDAEQRYLRLATCAKLLELSTNRAYDLDADDCRTIKAAYLMLPSAELRGPSVAGWGYRTVFARLLRQGRFQAAWSLASGSVLGRAILLRFAPRPLRGG